MDAPLMPILVQGCQNKIGRKTKKREEIGMGR
jgi:hypothetical protein